MNEANLFPYQIEPVRHLVNLLRSGQNCLDGSDGGVGKTAMACGVIRALDLPTLVVAPQISLTAWRRMGEHIGTEFDVINPELLQTGKTPFGSWQHPRPSKLETDLVCDRCQLVVDFKKPTKCTRQRYGLHCVEPRKRPHRYGKFTWNDGIKFLVVDEVHRFGALDSLNADMLIAARRQGILTLGLSATAADSPLQLRALGYVLGLHQLLDGGDDDSGGFYRFAFRMGCRRNLQFGGIYFAGDDRQRREKVGEIHKLLFPSRGIRVRVSDLGSAFPCRQITTELYDLGSKGEASRLDRLYADMDGAIASLNAGGQGADSSDHPLTKILRARQEIELVMVPLFVDLARQYLESRMHVAVFVNFKSTMDELSKRLRTNCRIEGGQTPELRQKFLDDYLSDKEPVILVNSAAGGVSINLHDIHGNFPRVGIVSLGFSAINTRQVLCRLWRSGAKTKCLYRLPLVVGTVQEKIHKAVAAKLDRIDMLNDGDLMAANLPLLRGGEINI